MIKTYPEMNENIKESLKRSDDFHDKYALARIEELEEALQTILTDEAYEEFEKHGIEPFKHSMETLAVDLKGVEG